MNKIGFRVALTHLAILLIAIVAYAPKKEVKPINKIIVQTIELKPSPPKPKARPKPKPVAPPPKKRVVRQKRPVSKAKKVLNKLEEKKRPPPPEKKVVVETPKKIDALKIDKKTSSNYPSVLLSFLQERLILPEVGEVKIELTLTREGRVKQFKVVSETSQANRDYLEEQIMRIKFPPFDKDRGDKIEESFILSFRNR